MEIREDTLGVFSLWLNSFHVHSFTLVSGYLFSSLKWEKGKYKNFKPFFINKAKRLLIPYMFVSVVWAIPIGQVFYHYGLSQIIWRYALATAPSQLWFLIMLFWCFIGAWLLSDVINSSNFATVAIAFLSFGIGFAGGIVLPNFFCIWTAYQFFPFFVLGMKVKQWKWIERIPGWLYGISDVFLFSLWLLIHGGETTVVKFLTVCLEFVLHFVGALMSWSILQWIGDRINWRKNKVFSTLSKYSMPIYLFHQQLIYFTIIWLNGKVNAWINAGVNFVVALISSLLISMVLMYWKTTRMLIGEK